MQYGVRWRVSFGSVGRRRSVAAIPGRALHALIPPPTSHARPGPARYPVATPDDVADGKSADRTRRLGPEHSPAWSVPAVKENGLMLAPVDHVSTWDAGEQNAQGDS